MVTKIDTYHDNIRHDAIALLPPRSRRLLDMGGGVGATAAFIKETGRAEFVVVADQVSETLPSVDRCFHGDFERSELFEEISAEGPFDTILCLDVLEHLRNPWAAVAELKGMLAPGGTMIVSVPNVNNRAIVIPLLLRGRWDLQDQGLLDRTHLRWFTKDSLSAMISEANLTIDRIEATMIPRDRYISKLSLGWLDRFLAVQYIVRAINI